jgi:hypothetical protein
VGQLAVTAAPGWSGLDARLAERRAEIDARAAAFTMAMLEAPGAFAVEHSGAYFAGVRHGPMDPARPRAAVGNAAPDRSCEAAGRIQRVALA